MPRLSRRTMSSSGAASRPRARPSASRLSSRAESNFFRLLGADLVNMTIGTECPLAAEAGLSYCAIAMATDYDCWKEDEQAVTVDAVMAVMAK